MDDKFPPIKPVYLESCDLEIRLCGTYTDYLNIIDIDSKVRKLLSHDFATQNERIEEIENEIELMKEKIKKPQIIIERKQSLNRIKDLESKLIKTKEEKPWVDYVEESKEILYEFFMNENSNQNNSFQKKSDEIVDSEIIFYRHRLIDYYLSIASKYVNVHYVREIKIPTNCPNCGQNNLSDEGCECGYQKQKITNRGSDNKTSTSVRNDYKDEQNFYKALLRFMGQQTDFDAKNLFEELDNYFEQYGLPKGEEIRKLPKINGKKEGTDRPMMLTALRVTKNAVFYEDINLICHLYWGWDLPNISHLVDLIIDDYRRTQKVYETMGLTRSSCLNIQYRLFKHLQARSYKCDSTDFKMVKTRDILEYYDQVWQKMCEEAGLTFIATI